MIINLHRITGATVSTETEIKLKDYFAGKIMNGWLEPDMEC